MHYLLSWLEGMKEEEVRSFNIERVLLPQQRQQG